MKGITPAGQEAPGVFPGNVAVDLPFREPWGILFHKVIRVYIPEPVIQFSVVKKE